MIYLYPADEYAAHIQPERIDQAARAVLVHQNAPAEADLSVVVDGDERLQALNHEFMGIDAPTDVLSFPSGGDEIDPETGRAYLGDVILSYPRALEQSTAAGHAVDDEILLLVVHGILHLLGHDHAEPEEKAAMWNAQGEILTGLGVRLSRLPE
jgi:probable rRNA maturation factor